MTEQSAIESESGSTKYEPPNEVIALIKKYPVVVRTVLQSLEKESLKLRVLQNRLGVDMGVTLQDQSFYAILEILEKHDNISRGTSKKSKKMFWHATYELKDTGKQTLAWITERYKSNL